MARFNKRSRQIEEPAVNLTPLIDVVFVILIMFILVAPLLEIDKVELADASSHPETKQVEVREKSAIAIHVRQDNSVWLNEKKVNTAQLAELLKQAKEKYPGVQPQLFHDKRAQFGTYQMVKNAAEEAGFHQIDIILKPG